MGRLATTVDHFAAEHDRQLRETREQLEAADADLRGYIRDVESHLRAVIEMFERHLREDHGSSRRNIQPARYDASVIQS